MPAAELVGCQEIAERLNVPPNTVYAWRHRKLLPEPEHTVGGRPAWKWSTIRQWADRTGRLPHRARGKLKAVT